uniref:5-hydroxyisourate hydrolase n=1 Tax=Vannella robusta TaxID=1487602 RepID=A0A7S4I9F3_9EUKA
MQNVLAQFHCFGDLATPLLMSAAAGEGTISMSCHILDTAQGTPARGMKIHLEQNIQGDEWVSIHRGTSNDDGRVTDIPKNLISGVYRMTFYTKDYFIQTNVEKFFYPVVSMIFTTTPNEHFHIPLLISPFGYTTYRGS